MCVFPLPDGDARKTQRFILVRARECPTSSGGDVSIILHLSACTGRIQVGIVVDSKSEMEAMYGYSCTCVPPYPFLCPTFYSSKGRPRLHGVDNKIGVDRGVVRSPTRGLRTGVASSCLVIWYFGDDIKRKLHAGSYALIVCPRHCSQLQWMPSSCDLL